MLTKYQFFHKKSIDPPQAPPIWGDNHGLIQTKRILFTSFALLMLNDKTSLAIHVDPSNQTKISARFKYNNYVSIARALIEMEGHHWLWRAIKWPITCWNIHIITIYIDLKNIFLECMGSNWQCTSSFQLTSQSGSCCLIMPVYSLVNSP